VKVTVLGSATSQGIPVIACECNVCKSTNPKDKRLRASILIQKDGKNIVIDSGPDFRQQMLKNNVSSLDCILFTHEHKDHIAGLDDVRAFNFKQKKAMEIYCSERVENALKREYHYIFAENRYPGVPSVNINLINKNPFQLFNTIDILPIEVLHYKLPVLGFRIDDFTYITDAKTISNEEKIKILGTKTLIINCLRREEHISHFNLKEALAFINEIKAETTYLTHISHLFGTHEEIEQELPPNVFVAYDGLVINC
tara:strand:- start:112 stop:876 length:765 start_codon:yes stop_codon:yes gene_type:complete